MLTERSDEVGQAGEASATSPLTNAGLCKLNSHKPSQLMREGGVPFHVRGRAQQNLS